MISLDGFLFLQVRLLKSGATVTKDMCHIIKRFVRRLFSKNAFRVHGVTIDVDVLCTLAKTLGVARRLANAIKEVDRMLFSLVGCFVKKLCPKRSSGQRKFTDAFAS